jgi:hypothetical protein
LQLGVRDRKTVIEGLDNAMKLGQLRDQWRRQEQRRTLAARRDERARVECARRDTTGQWLGLLASAELQGLRRRRNPKGSSRPGPIPTTYAPDTRPLASN